MYLCKNANPEVDTKVKKYLLKQDEHVLIKKINRIYNKKVQVKIFKPATFVLFSAYYEM